MNWAKQAFKACCRPKISLSNKLMKPKQAWDPKAWYKCFPRSLNIQCGAHRSGQEKHKKSWGLIRLVEQGNEQACSPLWVFIKSHQKFLKIRWNLISEALLWDNKPLKFHPLNPSTKIIKNLWISGFATKEWVLTFHNFLNSWLKWNLN